MMTSLTKDRATRRTLSRLILGGASVLALSACVRDASFDSDLRGFGKNTFSTADAALQASGQRPEADGRGIISYPGYQVAVARQGDTVDSVAARVGIPAAEIAQYNALQPGVTLRQGEIVALPRRVGAAPVGTGTAYAGTPGVPGTAGGTGGSIDVTTLASGAIDRATGTTGATTAARPATPTTALPVQPGPEPARHRVERGETAYTIARMYNVNVKALADWNGLGSDLAVREGQTLLIPLGASATGTVVATGANQVLPPVTAAPKPVAVQPAPVATTAPATGTKPKPAATPAPAPAPAPAAASGGTHLSMPVQGKIIRGYQKKKNDGIDIAAPAGTPVLAAGDGTVAWITKNTDGTLIMVVRHTGNLLTVYANIDGLTVKKGDTVRRGQKVATVRAANPSYVHFEVRQGMESIDPATYF